MYRTLRMAEPFSSGENIEKSVRVTESEKNIHHIILRQVLHLEVDFCCPNFPYKLENDEDFSVIVGHLKEIFQKELESIDLKIKRLREEIVPRQHEIKLYSLFRKD